MSKKLKYISHLFSKFLSESKEKPQYEIVDIYTSKKEPFCIKTVIKLSTRHVIQKNIRDIISDDDYIDGLDKKAIRLLTQLATVESMSPDFTIMSQKLGDDIDEYILEIKSKNERTSIKKTPSEISRDKNLISKFTPIEANRIGYLAGVNETVKEYQVRANRYNTGM